MLISKINGYLLPDNSTIVKVNTSKQLNVGDLINIKLVENPTGGSYVLRSLDEILPPIEGYTWNSLKLVKQFSNGKGFFQGYLIDSNKNGRFVIIFADFGDLSLKNLIIHDVVPGVSAGVVTQWVICTTNYIVGTKSYAIGNGVLHLDLVIYTISEAYQITKILDTEVNAPGYSSNPSVGDTARSFSSAGFTLPQEVAGGLLFIKGFSYFEDSYEYSFNGTDWVQVPGTGQNSSSLHSFERATLRVRHIASPVREADEGYGGTNQVGRIIRHGFAAFKYLNSTTRVSIEVQTFIVQDYFTDTPVVLQGIISLNKKELVSYTPTVISHENSFDLLMGPQTNPYGGQVTVQSFMFTCTDSGVTLQTGSEQQSFMYYDPNTHLAVSKDKKGYLYYQTDNSGIIKVYEVTISGTLLVIMVPQDSFISESSVSGYQGGDFVNEGGRPFVLDDKRYSWVLLCVYDKAISGNKPLIGSWPGTSLYSLGDQPEWVPTESGQNSRPALVVAVSPQILAAVQDID